MLQSSAMEERLEALQQMQHEQDGGGFVLTVAPARPKNAFICNETHFRALQAQIHATSSPGEASLKAAYFLHIPFPKKGDEDHSALAHGVANLLNQLVQLESKLQDNSTHRQHE